MLVPWLLPTSLPLLPPPWVEWVVGQIPQESLGRAICKQQMARHLGGLPILSYQGPIYHILGEPSGVSHLSLLNAGSPSKKVYLSEGLSWAGTQRIQMYFLAWVKNG